MEKRNLYIIDLIHLTLYRKTEKEKRGKKPPKIRTRWVEYRSALRIEAVARTSSRSFGPRAKPASVPCFLLPNRNDCGNYSFDYLPFDLASPRRQVVISIVGNLNRTREFHYSEAIMEDFEVRTREKRSNRGI